MLQQYNTDAVDTDLPWEWQQQMFSQDVVENLKNKHVMQNVLDHTMETEFSQG